MSAAQLIESAMAGVEIVTCPRCQGERFIGVVTLRITCPTCRGAGVTTTNRREVRPMGSGANVKTYTATQEDRDAVVKALRAYGEGHVVRNLAVMLNYGLVRVVFPATIVDDGEPRAEVLPDA